MSKILPIMLPATKGWRRKENVKVGNICLMLYKRRVKDEYKLVNVLEVHSSQDGLVRTAGQSPLGTGLGT